MRVRLPLAARMKGPPSPADCLIYFLAVELNEGDDLARTTSRILLRFLSVGFRAPEELTRRDSGTLFLDDGGGRRGLFLDLANGG